MQKRKTHPAYTHGTTRGALRRARTLLAGLALVALMAACSGAPLGASDDIVLEFLQTQTLGTSEIKHFGDATVSGTVELALRTNPRFTEVHFHVDDPARLAAPLHVDDAAPFTVQFDTRVLADGVHNLTVVAQVDRGKPSLTSVAFTVDNGVSDGATPEGGDEADGTAPEGGESAGDETGGEADTGTTDGADGGTEDDGTPSDGGPDGATDGADTGSDSGTDTGSDGDDGSDPDDGVQEPALPAATLYVAPYGSGDGRSASSPTSIGRAVGMVQPGDVVYLDSGIYPINVRFTRSGTASEPITWTSGPGEWAIFDGSDQTPLSSGHRFHVSYARYNVFMNLEVRNGPREGIWVENSHDNVFRDIVTHGHFYSGIGNYLSDRNLYEGITTYDNYDFTDSYGDHADGIALSSGDRNVVRRVVTFNNADDGVDAWRSTNTIIENVVSYGNGRGTNGNGNGIKAGGNSEWNNTVVRNSIAFHNRSNGFDDNSGKGIAFENNTAFENGGYSFMGGSTTTRRNNIAFGGRVGFWGAMDSNNSWDLGIGDPSFASTDPDSDAFLALSSSSPAIGAGTGGVDLGAIPYASSYAGLIGPRVLGGTSLLSDTLALRRD